MKKIEKVSIANISFSLDKDAYVSLRHYLDSLHSHYDSEPAGAEIIADIEARIAELILSEQVYTKVVNKELIDSIVAQLGTPEEIEDMVAETGRPTVQPTADSSIPRRLYRSAEGRVFGGVCSGMAHYWNSSVAWFRLGFLAPFILFVILGPFDRGIFLSNISDFFGGMAWGFFVLYVVLWMSIPIAKTSRQKLESRGERITSSSIRQNLQQSATTPSSKKAASVTAEVLTVLGQIVLFFIKFVVAIIGIGLLLGALGVVVGMIAVPFAADPVSHIGIAGIELTTGGGLSEFLVVMLCELVLLCVMLPLFVVAMSLLGFVFGWKLGRRFFVSALGLWGFALIATIVIGVSNGRAIRDAVRERNTKYGLYARPGFSADNANNSRLLREFLDREDNGTNTITVDVAGDSVVVTSVRDYAGDSLTGASGEVLQLRKRVVLRDPASVEEALRWTSEE
ncbi:MAG: PspC domain-containing protein [Rikenellaceae bacterium]|jgi:phage shock protein PspC (stress-responsive transcriptional regulator)|nr:PspC domain-containing protein [Rikenellaceae bacterium]